LLCFILTSCAGKYHLSNFYGQAEIVLNKSQLNRFNNYLSGEYYSYELNRKVSHRPIMFAISIDGTTSLLFACASISNECDPNVSIYQVLKRYSKKSNKEMYIFALKNKIVWSGNNYLIKGNKLNVSSGLLKNINIDLEDSRLFNNSYYDISLMPIVDDDFEN